MKRRTKLGALLLTAVVCLGALTGCGEETTANELEVRVGLSALPVSGDPVMETSADGQTVLLHLYEGLMKKTADGAGTVSAAPAMARSYNEEENFDGTVVYTFKLRESAKWSDGKPVTAEDFVYAWQRLVNPATGSPNHSLLRMVEGYGAARSSGDATKLAVSAKNENTLVVKLSYRCPYFISDVCTAVATAPLRQDVTAREGWADQWAGMMTNGAYQVMQNQGDELDLVRSAAYYDDRVLGPAAISMRKLDAAAAWQAYQAGELDAVSALPEEQLAERAKNPAWKPAVEADTYSIVFNNSTAPLDDPLVRRALSLAIDRSALTAVAGAGTVAAEGLVPAGIAGKDAETDFRTEGGALLPTEAEDYAANSQTAKELLAQSGYSGGEAFPALTLLYVSDGADAAVQGAVAATVRTMWQGVLRVNVEVKAVTQAELAQALRTGAYNMAAMAVGTEVNDAAGYLDRWHSGDEDNVADYANSAFNTLVEVIHSAYDETARMGLLHDAEQLLLDDAALAPLFTQGGGWELRQGLTGAFRDALGRLYLGSVMVDINA